MAGRFLRGGGCADRSGQELLAFAPLLLRPGLLRESSRRAGFLSLTLPARGFPFLGLGRQPARQAG